MITARTTRLVRVPDLQTFRRAAVELACGGSPLDARHRLVIIPTHAAGAYLLRAIERHRLAPGTALALPELTTRRELHGTLGARLAVPRPMLGDAEREVLMGVACRAAAKEGVEPPFRLRPALVVEILEFYDTLYRHGGDIATFERLSLGALEPGAVEDRGAERLVLQTKFLVRAFGAFERLREASGSTDEHLLRADLIATTPSNPCRHVVVTVADRRADAHGLFAADWDLLTRLPGLEQIDVLTTDGAIAGPLHERIHQLLPGIEEVHPFGSMSAAPRLLAPSTSGQIFVARDREEEIAGFARRVRGRPRSSAALERAALVVRRPLPYVYLAREVLRSAGIPAQMFDAVPLAAEPFATVLDAVMECATANFTRGVLLDLLRSPQLQFRAMAPERGFSALDRALSEAGYLGGLESLGRLVDMWSLESPSRPSADVARAAALAHSIGGELDVLRVPAPADLHLERLIAFLRRHEQLPPPDDPFRARLLRGRAAIFDALQTLRSAHARFDSTPVEFEVVAAIVRRWIEGRTFAPLTGDGGVHVVDAESARFGDFDHVQLAGLVEGEWPDAPRRNIFYPAGLLRDLGWGLESERVDAIRSAFNDLLRLPSTELVVSTFTLEDDALVTPSPLLDAVAASGFDVVVQPDSSTRVFEHEALALAPLVVDHLPPLARAAATFRETLASPPATGATRPVRIGAYAVSAIERYQDCPFKFFAADVLKLEEPVEDEPMRSPRARGRFLHEVFQRFFEAWDASGHGTITVDRLDEARDIFTDVAEGMLAEMPDADAALERARLFGSAVSTGIADLVLGLEASRPAAVRERWLEYRLEGEFALGTGGGRYVGLKGVADRIDLLEGNRLRVIDYKSGAAPAPRRALQAAIYALCAQERLLARDGTAWEVDEAAYIALSGKRPLVPVVSSGAGDAAATLAAARDRLLDLVDAIEQGRFPPRPHELRLCTYCAYPSVCRKDYVGDE